MSGITNANYQKTLIHSGKEKYFLGQNLQTINDREPYVRSGSFVMDKTQLSFGKNIDKLKNLQNTTNLLPDTPGYRNLNGIQQKKFIQERNNANTQIQNYIRQSIWALPSENILEMTALDMKEHPSDTDEEEEERKMFHAAHQNCLRSRSSNKGQHGSHPRAPRRCLTNQEHPNGTPFQSGAHAKTRLIETPP